MCELFAMSSRVPSTVSFSVRTFAAHGDGWSIAFFEGREVRLPREPEPPRDGDIVDFMNC